MQATNQPLLQPFRMGDLNLRNRVVMAPLTRSRADNKRRVPTDLHVEYYKQRAGAGLIISEGAQVSERGIGYINTPGIHNEEQAEAWKKVTDAVHEEGGRMFVQLWHCGRISHPKFHDGEKPLAPSAINPNTQVFTDEGLQPTAEPKEMSIQEIQQTIMEFRNAAVMAKKANFDGIELHAANGYLFHQFFNKNANLRTDDYGGNIPNRARFFFDVLEICTEVWAENRIGCHFNPSFTDKAGITATDETIATFDYIIDKLNAYNLAYVHVSEPFTDVSDIPYLEKEVAKHYRPIYKGTLMANKDFDRESGNKIIEEGIADLVSFGKLFISNPDLPERFRNKWPTAEWDQDTFYTSGPKGYTDYPPYKKEEVS
ncbi:alkene reductase [Christiangramia fulva]|uniref:Alkene reductase n=1 Tax=Christiangramia fulva TaxID=2126553 RepID=A0A2R3Z1B4_9FLAO|nr:alkene reductase [Christiangramia fulva]AVR44051.1 alkene reductase [Christiangramia fulva]